MYYKPWREVRARRATEMHDTGVERRYRDARRSLRESLHAEQDALGSRPRRQRRRAFTLRRKRATLAASVEG